MSALTLQLDDANASFEKLVETARALIPGRAPRWTDHNVHDPGITLLELIAWNTEAQIYALGRTRRDERIAYAALLGVTPRGPQPATGLIWPTTGLTAVPWARGTELTRDDAARTDRDGAPAFAIAAPILLIDAVLSKVAVRDTEGRTSDVTISNRQDGAGFAPFAAAGTGVLRLTFKGSLATPRAPDAKTHAISLGVEVKESPSTSDSPGAGQPATFDATLECAGRRVPLRVISDGTRGLLQTGVLMLDTGNLAEAIGPVFSIELAPRAERQLRVPFVTRIEPNVLPIVDVRSVDARLTAASTGLPDQDHALPEPGLMFGGTAAVPQVIVDNGFASEAWSEVPDLSVRGPNERCFSLDRFGQRVRFGNGVNGAIPAAAASIHIKYDVCTGAAGNLPRRLRWRVTGIAGVFGENSAALQGGSNAMTPEDLQREVRSKLLRDRPIVTSTDLQDAALALEDLKVARAEEARPSCKGPAGLRTLVVLPESGTATEPWLASIRNRLKDRMPLGQQLRVVAPDDVSIGVEATLVAQPQVDPSNVRDAVLKELQQRFALVSSGGRTAWPFERDVTVREIQGWLRRLPGVARIVSVQVTKNGTPGGDRVKIERRQLPRLELDASAVSVLRPGEKPT